jgi:hypothetical protein
MYKMSQNLLTLPLEQQWRCQYYRAGTSLDDSQPTAIVMPLSVWTFDRGCVAASLDRAFALKPLDVECVRYWLLIDRLPEGTRLLINHKPVVRYTAHTHQMPFELDVTNYVMLGINWIMFRVEGETTEGFENVRLVAVECE